MLHTNKWKNYFLGFCFAGFLNFEGILVKIFGLSIESGFLNQLYAPLFLIVLGFSFVVFYYIRIDDGNRNVSVLFISTLFLSFLMILVSLNWSDTTKLLRDLTYLWLIFLIYQVFIWKDVNKKIIDKNFIKSFTISFLFIFPISSLIAISGSEIERFSGWILSKPQFSNMVMITGLIYLNHKKENKYKHFVSISCLILIFLSGTRTTLLVFGIYYAYHFLLLNSYDIVKRLIWISTVTVIVGLTVYLVFSSYINTIIELTSNYRAFSFEDIEQGSIFSRLSWYSTIVTSLITQNIFGGFGAGASENLLGLLPHFDFLRFWYDYTILFALLFMVNIILLFYRNRKYRTMYHKIIDGIVLTILILSLMGHNVFQSFDMVVMIMLFLMHNNSLSKYELSSRFYRISINTSPGIS